MLKQELTFCRDSYSS